MRPPSRARLRNAFEKTTWGLRVVGPVATLKGAARVGALRATSPRRARVRARSGFDLEFGVPHQVPTVLVAFGDVIDPEYPFLGAVVQPGEVVVDVGAAIGQFTVFAGRVLQAQVHAFEPDQSNLDSLRANLGLNGIEAQVEVHELALSDWTGEASFGAEGDTFRAGLGQTGPTAHQVRVVRLDDELEALGVDRVRVLKINVAGEEAGVIDGADRFLSRGGADVLVLLIGTGSYDRYERLAGYGYTFGFYLPVRRTLHRLNHLDGRMLADRPFPARHVLAVHERALEGLAARGITLV